ncbi:flagellar assembly protein FliX [Maricaulis sp.]|uniref:flagellar assembly protein FliX n=1 Tax=Maricaulis sp. TaxID=1486257 RepID=UPI003A91DC45
MTVEQEAILVMKVTGPRSASSVSSSKRTSGSRAGGDSFTLEQAAQSASAMAAAPMSGVNSVDAILALQSVGDFTEARKQATGRAMNLLDVLDELKLSLLEGGLPKAKLVALMDLLQTRRDDTNDAGLEAALDEVEIRAAVELAKFG